jgi:cytochrome P450 / NADPH-cytochrome P450 reductase
LEKIRISEGGTPTDSKDLFSQTLKAHLSDQSIAVPRRGLEETKVVGVETLTTGGEPIKKRIDIQLPAGSTYRAGDYIAVLPSNPKASVLRALRRFNLPVSPAGDKFLSR